NRGPPAPCVSLHSMLCPNSCGRWNYWDPNLRRPQFPFSPQQDHLPVSLPDPVLAARASPPDPAQWLFQRPTSIGSCLLAVGRQTREPSVSVTDWDSRRLPSVPLLGLHPVSRMTCGSQPTWPTPVHCSDLPARLVRDCPGRLRDQNSPAERTKEQ